MSTDLTADLFVSLDGWAGSDGLPGYFGYSGPELESWIASQHQTAQLTIMGRKTYAMLADLPEEARDDGWEQMSRQDTVVFSRTLETADWPHTRICSTDLLEEVERLKAEGDVPIRIVGSLSVAQQLVSAGLVDRLRVMTFPLIAGDWGREAAFAGIACADLELLDHQVLDGRVHLTEYRLTGQDIPRA